MYLPEHGNTDMKKVYDATWQFTTKGIAQNIVQFKSEDGTYNIEKGSIVFKFPKNKIEDPLMKLDGNNLVLTSKKRKTFEKYLRLQP